MTDTKENILQTALRLFARNGYEAVSVSKIAGELGMTKGALYRHYKNKQDIFDSIFARIHQEDVTLAKQYGVPEDVFEKSPSAFQHTSMEQLKNFTEASFNVWLTDEFSRNFRKMLTIEQYRSFEMGEMYKLCAGQVDYIEDVFREMIKQGVLKKQDTKLLALEFFAPYHFLLDMEMVHASSSIEESENLLKAHIEKFMKENLEQKKDILRRKKYGKHRANNGRSYHRNTHRFRTAGPRKHGHDA